MTQWGLFNDDSADWTEDEAVEADFYSEAEARSALMTRYPAEEDMVVHVVEDADEDDEDEGDE